AKGDLDHVIADYTEAIQRGLDANIGAAYTNRGLAYTAKGDLDRAIADYNEAIRLDPKKARPYYFRGLTWVRKSDLQKALADLTRFSELAPDDSDGREAIAFVKKA